MWFVVKGGWPQMILLFLIMRCTPTIRELIEATPLSPSSPSATSLSALAPAQRAGAQRLCALTLIGSRARRRKLVVVSQYLIREILWANLFDPQPHRAIGAGGQLQAQRLACLQVCDVTAV